MRSYKIDISIAQHNWSVAETNKQTNKNKNPVSSNVNDPKSSINPYFLHVQIRYELAASSEIILPMMQATTCVIERVFSIATPLPTFIVMS